MKWLCLGIISCILCGCAATKQVDRVLANQGYILTDEIDRGLLTYMAFQQESALYVANELDSLSNELGKLEDIAIRIRRIHADYHLNWKDLIDRLKSGDRAFWFEYSRGEYSDEGFLVLRDRTVVFRFPLLGFSSSDNGDDKPDEVHFERL